MTHVYYSLTLVENKELIVRALASNEGRNVTVFSGKAARRAHSKRVNFLAIHGITEDGAFPLLKNHFFDEIESDISCVEFLQLAKEPTLIASDSNQIYLFILEYDYSLTLKYKFRVHEGIVKF